MIRRLAALFLVAAGVHGLSGIASAGQFTVMLTDVYSGSPNGSAAGILSGDLIGTFDDISGVVTVDGGTIVEFQINPFNSLFTHIHTDWSTGNNSYAATAYSCIEGSFGPVVGANICGNYTFGADFVDQSSIDYSTIPGTRIIGGDDEVVGPQQQGADYAASIAFFDGSSLIINTPNWNGGLGTESTGGYQLRFEVAAVPPLNDDFDNATIASEPLPFSDAINTIAATTAVDDPNCRGNGPTVWYAYTPSADGALEADTFGSNYDTTLSVYTGSRGALAQIACNDDSGSLQSRATWQGEAGTTYYVMVGAFGSGSGGQLNFELKQAPPPAFSDVVVDSALVTPASGEALVEFEAVFREEVFVIATSLRLLQRGGRGSVFGEELKELFLFTDSVRLTVPFNDVLGGKGFVGGPAEFCITAIYSDPIIGSTSQEICADIRLRGDRNEQ